MQTIKNKLGEVQEGAPWNLYLRKFENFEIGGSETPPYWL